MFGKIKSWLLAIVAVVAGLFGVYLLTDDDKEELKKAKDEIEKAGEEVDEAKHFNNADNAAKYVDDVLSKLDGRRNKK